jgi:hypothetical protein
VFDFIAHGFIILKSRSRKKSLLRREFLHLFCPRLFSPGRLP